MSGDNFDEVLLVVGYDSSSLRRDGELEHMVIFRVAQDWPPQEMDVVLVSRRTDLVQNVISRRRIYRRILRVATKNILVL